MSSRWTSGRQGGAVGIHFDLLGGVSEAGKIVHDEVETLAWAGAVGGGIAQESGRKVVIGHRREIAFDEQLALGVSGERLGAAGLIAGLGRAGAIDRAAGKVDELRDADFLGFLGQLDGADVIDVVGNIRRELANRIIA